jgi:uncharacterized protein (DUF1778 family)
MKTTPKGDRITQIGVRMTQHEKQLLSMAAKADGLKLATWLRRLGLRAAGVLKIA